MSQHGAYTLLLWEYYINGPIPARAQQVLNICLAHAEHEKVDAAFVLKEFFVEKYGYYHHERADEEIAKREDIRNKRVNAGKARQQMLSTSPANAQHVLTQSQSHIKPNTPLTPLSGGNGAKPLTTRERAKLEKELQRIQTAMQGADYDPADALRRACERTGIDYSRAEGLLP